jgi:hypothetical protein
MDKMLMNNLVPRIAAFYRISRRLISNFKQEKIQEKIKDRFSGRLNRSVFRLTTFFH